MLETAKLFVDDAVLRAIEFPRDRSAFFAEFKTAIAALPQFTRAFGHQFDPEAVHDEIQRKLGSAIIKSDLATLCVRAAHEGSARVEHRLPPAYRDGDKPENKLGDLIIWFEILQYSKDRKEDFDKVLFVTNDEKADWVYAPQRRMDFVGGVRKPISNDKSGIKIIDPRLASEFNSITGHSTILICNLAALIEGLSKESASDFEQLSAAIQINLYDDAVTTTLGTALSDTPANETAASDRVAVEMVVSETTSPAPEMVTEVVASAPEFSYDPEALRDSEYQQDAPSVINEIIRSLKSHNWYAQNPAISQIGTISNEEFSPSAWFVLGRNIYQAACGNSQKAMDFIDNLQFRLSLLPADKGRHVLAGILFEIYFDSEGNFRNYPKARFIDIPLQLVAAAQYSDVRDFILHHLHNYLNRLCYQPGDNSELTLTLTSSPIAAEGLSEGKLNDLSSVKLNDVELVEPFENPYPGFPETYTIGSLVQQISHILAIPRWAIKRNFIPAVRPDAELILPENRRLNIRAACNIQG